MNKLPGSSTVVVTILLFMTILFACRDVGIDSDPNIKLGFSADSLLFDTVFTTVGSATRSFKVYNNHNQRIKIGSISLSGGTNSFFRINVDGASGLTIRDVEIGARDSLFVFVEVTVDPVNDQMPMIIADEIVFNTNGNVQDVKLVAWGQDAHFIYPNYADPDNGIQYHIITENTTWDNDLPHVVYGLAVVAPGVTLRVSEGARIHFHNNSSLIFLAESTMKVYGSAEEPVTFQGDRLEAFYKEIPGQWGRIWFTATSKDHEINHAIIKNGTLGLHVDTIGSINNPTLTIRNTIIKNMSIAGILAQGSHIVAENLIIANCGEHAAILALGGTYDFKHCTFANYFSLQTRRSPLLVLNNFYEDVDGVAQIREFSGLSFANCIIYGNLPEELGLDFFPGTNPSFLFDHCLLRTERASNGPSFINVLKNQNPLFKEIQNNDYRLLENSPAINAGNPVVANMVPIDILGNDRTQRPDIGAIQFYVIEEEEEE